MQGVKFWTDERVQFLKENYSKMTRKEIAEALGCTLSSVINKSHKLKLAKGTNSGRFQKGHVSWNKGMKGFCASPESSFKKGHRPYNTAQIGTIRLSKKDGHKYLLYKYKDHQWMPYQRYIWIQHHGAIPPGHNIKFKDGDYRNCNIDNLELISNADNLIANQKGNPHPALALTDKFIAGIMTRNNKQLRKKILENKELIQLKRHQILLNKELKKWTKLRS